MKMKFAILCVLTGAVAIAETFDAVADYNGSGGSQNAGSVWTYGATTTLNGSMHLLAGFVNGAPCGSGAFPQNLCTPTGAQTQQWLYGATPWLAGPSVIRNISGGTITFPGYPANFFPTNILLMAGGGSDIGYPDFTVVRFTAPAANVYNLTGSFSDRSQLSTVNLYISVNGVASAAAFGNFSMSNLNLSGRPNRGFHRGWHHQPGQRRDWVERHAGDSTRGRTRTGRHRDADADRRRTGGLDAVPAPLCAMMSIATDERRNLSAA